MWDKIKWNSTSQMRMSLIKKQGSLLGPSSGSCVTLRCTLLWCLVSPPAEKHFVVHPGNGQDISILNEVCSQALNFVKKKKSDL